MIPVIYRTNTAVQRWKLIAIGSDLNSDDLVAQTDHYKPNATALADFVLEGEKRYWLHPPSIALTER
jgi:hypothetical protein